MNVYKNLILFPYTGKLVKNFNYIISRELRGITRVVRIGDSTEGFDKNQLQLNKNATKNERNPFSPHQEEASGETELLKKNLIQLNRNNLTNERNRTSLEPVKFDDPPEIAQNFVPTFNFAAYVNKSETLQQLIKLGVNLSRIEKRKGLPEFLLKLDFEKDMKAHLMFLINICNIAANELGDFLTKNPLIFKEDIDDLQTRINYLEVKKFKQSEISRIVSKNPFWLMFQTQRIDKRLGFFQTYFKLSGNEIRFLTTKQPRIITYKMEHIQQNNFSLKEEMGFNPDEMKCLLLSKPKLWMMNCNEITERYDFVHQDMKISNEQLVQCPEVLLSRLFRTKQRHKFLELLGKAQYDPTKDLYVSLKSLVEGADDYFVINVANSTMVTYNKFLRTL